MPRASESGDASSEPEPWEEDEPWEYKPAPRESQRGDYDAARRVYVLGTGAVGCFVAHSLLDIVNAPPVTLLTKRTSDIIAFERQGRVLTVHRGKQADRQGGCEIEALRNMTDPVNAESPDVLDESPVLNLVVCVKAADTLSALTNVKHRLSRRSTVCLIQNGMGQVEEVIQALFPDLETRPNFIMGVNSHGVYRPRPFETEHRGKGFIFMSIVDTRLMPYSVTASRDDQGGVPREQGEAKEDSKEIESIKSESNASTAKSLTPRQPDWGTSARYLMRTLTRSLTLSAVGLKPEDLYIAQLEKLAINAVINPLTAIFQCRNGDLLSNRHMTAMMRLMLAEISMVLQSLPELRHYFPASNKRRKGELPNPQSNRSNRTIANDIHFSVANRLSPETLEYMILTVARRTQHNESSMMVDVKEARDTEIDYINGYIVQRGEELGIKCIINYTVMTMLQARATMAWRHSKQLAYEEDWNQLSPDVRDILKSSGKT